MVDTQVEGAAAKKGGLAGRKFDFLLDVATDAELPKTASRIAILLAANIPSLRSRRNGDFRDGGVQGE